MVNASLKISQRPGSGGHIEQKRRLLAEGVEFVRTRLGEKGSDGMREISPIEGSEFVLSADTVIVAIGLDVYDPTEMDEYGYTRYDNVITSAEFERMLNSTGPTGGQILCKNGKPPLSEQTIRMTLGTLRTFFERVSEWGYPDAPRRVLIFNGDLPTPDAPLPKFLSDPDAAKLMRTAADADGARARGRLQRQGARTAEGPRQGHVGRVDLSGARRRHRSLVELKAFRYPIHDVQRLAHDRQRIDDRFFE